jgi:hypothetical protein
MHVQKEDKTDDTKDCFSEILEYVFDETTDNEAGVVNFLFIGATAPI